MSSRASQKSPQPADVPTRSRRLILRDRNLPAKLRIGADPYLAALPWEATRLDLSKDARRRAITSASVMPSAPLPKSGTLVLTSGKDNPTTLNFLPETHIVVVAATRIVGDYERIWQKLRAAYGKGLMPRTVNFITGPSRSADIGQTLLLGAHGPRDLHIIIVGE